MSEPAEAISSILGSPEGIQRKETWTNEDLRNLALYGLSEGRPAPDALPTSIDFKNEFTTGAIMCAIETFQDWTIDGIEARKEHGMAFTVNLSENDGLDVINHHKVEGTSTHVIIPSIYPDKHQITVADAHSHPTLIPGSKGAPSPQDLTNYTRKGSYLFGTISDLENHYIIIPTSNTPILPNDEASRICKQTKEQIRLRSDAEERHFLKGRDLQQLSIEELTVYYKILDTVNYQAMLNLAERLNIAVYHASVRSQQVEGKLKRLV